MKKLFAGIIFVFIFLLSSLPVLAQEAQSSPSAQAVVEYVLPYPGMLPDHPLFVLKSARDWIFERLITDPLRKSEFYILQSDKRLAMAGMLLDQQKSQDAAQSVIISGEFMEKAIAAARQIRSGGGEVPGHILDRFDRSVAKHLMLIGEYSQREGDTSGAFVASLETFRALSGELPDLR